MLCEYIRYAAPMRGCCREQPAGTPPEAGTEQAGSRRALRPGALSAALLLALFWACPAQALGPSFDCSGVVAGSVEDLVCRDQGLAELDRALAGVYAEAFHREAAERPAAFKAEQRDWVRGRNGCARSGDPRQCVADSYARRIAELTARYGLVPPVGQARFTCEDDPGAVVLVRFFATDPGTLVAERRGLSRLMFSVRSGSGARYSGRDTEFWEHQGEALAVWGHGAPQVRCVQAP